MICNSVEITIVDIDGIKDKILSCIQECAMNGEEYVTFKFTKENFNQATIIDKILSKIPGMSTLMITDVKDKDNIDFYLKIMWTLTKASKEIYNIDLKNIN